MSYALKYQLFFTDVENNKFKIEIHQKDFVLDPLGVGTQPTELIGSGNPAQIKWDADDDIYSPIIGSRCVLSFFVTDTKTYDDFYKSGEREYKVKILEYASYGKDWDKEDLNYDFIDQNWDGEAGAEIFYKPIWEGYIVTDGYKEAVITTPHEIKLEAIDGLGTLDTFDVPTPTDNSSDTQQMFFYLKEILKLTGHSFDLYISNDIRIDGGATNDTIFHDISIDRYIFSDKNLVLMNAKEALKHILKMTNSRLFQSFARWYVINNSGLIDNRITTSTYTGIGTESTSDADIVNEPSEPVEEDLYPGPDITLKSTAQGNPMIDGDSYQLIAENKGTPVVSYVFTKPDGSTVSSTSGVLFLGTVTTSNDGDVYSVVGTDANGNTDSDTFTLDVDARVVPPEEPDVNLILRLNINNNVNNAYTSQERLLRNYTASQAGDSFTMSFEITSLTGEFTDVSQITTLTTTFGSISKALNGDHIRITVTGTLPGNGHIGDIVVGGNPDSRNFTHSYATSTSSLSNASVSPTSLSVRIGKGKTYTRSIDINPDSGFEFQGAGNVQVLASDNSFFNISQKLDGTKITVVLNGTMGIESKSTTLTFSGQPKSNQPASSISFTPASPLTIANNAGYFDISVTSNGNFRASSERFLSLSPSSGAAGSNQTIRIKFPANNRSTSRSDTISFFPSSSSSVLAQLVVTQESIA